MKNIAPKFKLIGAFAFCLIVLSAFSMMNDKVTICHKNHHEITISINALEAHLDHGDNIGPCGRPNPN